MALLYTLANLHAKATVSERNRPLTPRIIAWNATRPKWQPGPTRRRDSHPHEVHGCVVRLSAV